MRGTVVIGAFLATLLVGCVAPAPTPPANQSSNSGASASQAPATASAPTVMPRPRATGTPEDARRHLVRGMAAIEMAKSEADLAGAEDEFRMATEIDPTMAAAWFNLGAVQARMQRYEEAIASYNHYLELSPDAGDAPRIRDEVIKLQYRLEQQAKTQGRVGIWVADGGAFYRLTLEGEHMLLLTDNDGRYVPDAELIVNGVFGRLPNRWYEHAGYQLTLRGNRVSGIWKRSALQTFECTIPPESAEAVGELNDRDGTLLLRHPRTIYRAVIKTSLTFDDFCGEVTVVGKKTVEEKLHGPLPTGGLGVKFYGLTGWGGGAFSALQYGWQGRLAISLTADSVAYAAGLREKDEILAINGVPVKSLTAGQAMMLINGQPGTKVTLLISRSGIREPFAITMQRIKVR
jgi:tetratricopeptide (TPR) repeat protein